MKNRNQSDTIKLLLIEPFLILITILYCLITIYISSILDIHTSESSIIELSQVLLISSAFIICSHRAITTKSSRIFSLLCAAFFLVIFIREMDGYIENFFPEGAWIYPELVVLFFSTLYLLQNKKEAYSQIIYFSQARSFSIFLIGFFIVFIFSRIAGCGDFWKKFMHEYYNRDIKNLIEESLELLGYALMHLGIITLTNKKTIQLNQASN